jgi:hypothetical protein
MVVQCYIITSIVTTLQTLCCKFANLDSGNERYSLNTFSILSPHYIPLLSIRSVLIQSYCAWLTAGSRVFHNHTGASSGVSCVIQYIQYTFTHSAKSTRSFSVYYTLYCIRVVVYTVRVLYSVTVVLYTVYVISVVYTVY